MSNVIMFSDGGSRGNPGPAGVGVIIYQSAEVVVDPKNMTTELTELARIAEPIGETTNNQAEWTGVQMGLEWVSENMSAEGINVTCVLDSELVVKQIRGEYKVKNADLKPFNVKVKRLLSQFKSHRIMHVKREFNSVADQLANDAMDGAQ